MIKPEDLIGSSAAMQRLREQIGTIARMDAPVLITGESGSGKELVARALHFSGPRAKKPFVALYCAAIMETLHEIELFGVEEGKIIGVKGHQGKLEQAEGGTLYLDEIGTLLPSLQTTLQRVLQEGRFQRVKGEKEIAVNARIVCTTSDNLVEAIQQGTFREDLYYCINPIEIAVPPLRERLSDIRELVAHLLAWISQREKRDVQISGEAVEILGRHEWPGNVRELKGAIEYAVDVCEGAEILPEHLPRQVRKRAPGSVPMEPGDRLVDKLEELERKAILEALEGNSWGLGRTARELGMAQATLKNRIRLLGIRRGMPGSLKRLNGHKAREALEKARRRWIANNNKKCSQRAVRIAAEGMTCPACEQHSRDWRFMNADPAIEYYFICRKCGRSINAEDLRNLEAQASPEISIPTSVLPEVHPLTEQLYRALVERLPAVIFMTSFEEKEQMVYVSPQIKDILGYTPEEWLASPALWYQRLHEEDRERWEKEFSDTVMTKATSAHSAYRFMHKDGRVVWILGHVQIKRDMKTSAPLLVQAVGFDITDLKQTEADLQRRLEVLEGGGRPEEGRKAVAAAPGAKSAQAQLVDFMFQGESFDKVMQLVCPACSGALRFEFYPKGKTWWSWCSTDKTHFDVSGDVSPRLEAAGWWTDFVAHPICPGCSSDKDVLRRPPTGIQEVDPNVWIEASGTCGGMNPPVKDWYCRRCHHWF